METNVYDKEKIYKLLADKNIDHEIIEHEAVYNMEEMAELHLPHSDAEAKNY